MENRLRGFMKRLDKARRLIAPLNDFVLALALGLLVCSIPALAAGVGPIDLVVAVWEGAWGSPEAAANTLAKLTPLLLTGLAVSLGYRAGLLNIGCEGQLVLGALTSACVGLAAGSLPAFLMIPLTLFSGAAAGGLWAYPAIRLKQARGVHEVITTLLLNYLAIYLCEYLALGPLGDGSAMGRTPEIPQNAVWPHIWSAGAVGVTAAPLFAVFLSLVAQVWLSGTCWGFEAGAVGGNFNAAKAAGIRAEAWQRRMFVLSGALAGLAGAMEVVAVHHRFYRAFSPGYGFDGVTAAFLVNAAPGWLWLSGLLLASLRAADKWLQLSLGISPNVILIVQAVLLLCVAGGAGIRSGLRRVVERAAKGRGRRCVDPGEG